MGEDIIRISSEKKLDKEILILPLSIPLFYEAVEWGIFCVRIIDIKRKKEVL